MNTTHTFNIVPLSGDAGGPHKRFFVDCYLNAWLAALTKIYHQVGNSLEETAKLQQREEGMQSWLKCNVSVDYQERRDHLHLARLQLTQGAELLKRLAGSLIQLLRAVCLKNNILVCESQGNFTEAEQVIAQNNYICASSLLKETLSLLVQIKQELQNTNLSARAAVEAAQRDWQNHPGLAELTN